ncbi:MAG: bacteriophage holin [Candidatus Omnitrophota bacterium]|nr:MAG: bacteriophage holin [Candidatus Omnitrophota bacterium]
MAKLSIKGLALSFGISWSILMILLGIAAMFGWGEGMLACMSTLYIGYQATVFGIIIGAAWGFIDGAIFGAIVAFFYNKFAA